MKDEQDKIYERQLESAKLYFNPELYGEGDIDKVSDLGSEDVSDSTVREMMYIDTINELSSKLDQMKIENDALREQAFSSSTDDSKLSEYMIAEMQKKNKQIDDQAQQLKEVNGSLADITELLKDKDDENKRLSKEIKSQSKDIKSLTKQLSELIKLLKDKDDELLLLRKKIFGRSSQKVKKATASVEKDRIEEKDDFDGTGGSLLGASDNITGASGANNTTNTDLLTAQEEDTTKVKKEVIRPKHHTKMSAARVVIHKCDLSKLPEGSRLISVDSVKEYTKISYVQEDRFEIANIITKDGEFSKFYAPVDATDERYPSSHKVKGTHGTPEFLAELAINKYQFHLPIARQKQMIANDGASFSEQTICNYIEVIYKQLLPIDEHLKRRLLKRESLLYIDETWHRVKVLVNGVLKSVKHYIWVIVNKTTGVTYFLYDNGSRGRKVITDFLEDFQGTIMTDGYAVYKCFNDGVPGIDHLVCMAHVRAKFVNSLSSDLRSKYFLDGISTLYEIEKQLEELKQDDEAKFRIRQKRSLPILQRLKNKVDKYLKQKSSTIGTLMYKALSYYKNLYNQLVNYCNKGSYVIDNSEAERSIRPLTLGRKNYLHFGSEKSARIASFFYTVVETCKQQEINCRDYIVNYLYSQIEGNSNYANLLPVADCK